MSPLGYKPRRFLTLPRADALGLSFFRHSVQAPSKSRDELLTAERAAEAEVVAAERVYRIADATQDDQHDVALAWYALMDARTRSLATRAAMVAGFDEWTKYAAFVEASKL